MTRRFLPTVVLLWFLMPALSGVWEWLHLPPTLAEINRLHAQDPITIIDSGRRPPAGAEWSTLGATIATRTTHCAELGDAGQSLSYAQSGVSVSTINTAITNCTAGQVVFFNPGTYTLSGVVNLKSEITLRGSGADQSKLVFTGAGGCGQFSGFLCFPGPNQNGEPCCIQQEANWIAGFTPGTTEITLDDNSVGSSRPTVGEILVLDQLVDGSTSAADRFPDVFVCTLCGGATGWPVTGRTNRLPTQVVTVTAVDGNDFTITPAIAMPNWRTSSTCIGSAACLPKAFWITNAPNHSMGIEDLWVEHDSGTNGHQNIGGMWVRNSWVKGVKSVSDFGKSGSSSLKNTGFWYSSHITVQDSYFFNGTEPGPNPSTPTNGQDAYGVSFYASGNSLVQNNIFQFMRAPILFEKAPLMVVGYNFCIRMVTTETDNESWNFSGCFDNHATAGDFILLESNADTILNMENYHGNGQFLTAFRNHMVGKDAANTATSNYQASPIRLNAYYRFANLLGNVLGNSSWHENYQFVEGDGQSSAFGNKSIFDLGNQINTGHGASDDPNAVGTHYRFGNWDTETNAIRWCGNSGNTGWATTCASTSEVPTGLSLYAQAVPMAETLPASLYTTQTKVDVWRRVNGVNIAWPFIGPDVTGGAVSDAGGHVHSIPARSCFFDVMGGAYSDSTAKTFNAATCYQAAEDVPTITTSSPLTPSTVGLTCSFTIAATGGTEPYAFSVVSGALPGGASLASDGTCSGTYTTPETATFTVRVTDDMAETHDKQFEIVISAAAGTGVGGAAGGGRLPVRFP